MDDQNYSFNDLPVKIVNQLARISPALKAFITRVSQSGDIDFAFNEPVRIPRFYDYFNQTMLEITVTT